MANEAIFDAIEYDDIDQLEELLEEAGSDLDSFVNTPDDEGYSPLIVAASIGLVDIAETLLEHKAKIDYIAPDHASALFCAVQEKHWELVEALHSFKVGSGAVQLGERCADQIVVALGCNLLSVNARKC